MEALEPRRLFASPQLDLTFGDGGVASPAAENQFFGKLLLMNELPSHKIVGVGSNIVRFNEDGSLDTSFSGDGTLVLRDAEPSDVTRLPDGKFIVAYDAGEDLVFNRVNVDGTLDTTFGNAGTVTQHFAGSNNTLCFGLAAQSDGKILVIYLTNRATQPNPTFVSRLNADGTVDATFRGGTSESAPLDFLDLYDVAVQSDGKILVAGNIPDPAHLSFPRTTIERFNSDGTLDTSFGTNGRVLVSDQPQTVRSVNAITFDQNGKIVVTASFFSDAPSTDALLERFNATGAPDTSFGGGDGMVRFGLAPDANTAGPIMIGSDGRITVGLDGMGRGNLFRFNSDGSFDSSFGDNGVVVPANPRFIGVSSIMLDHNGNILASGTPLAVARFTDNTPAVFLSPQGHLFVTGTNAADTITFEHSGTQLIVHRNGVDTPFAFADLNKLFVLESGGGDVITVPFTIDCSIAGGAGNDSITLADGDQTINAGGGNDTVSCGAGHHEINLGDGDNLCSTGSGKDFIFSGDGDDTVTTGAQDDIVQCAGGDDSVTCAGGNDSINVGDGNDVVNAGAGDDIIDCGFFQLQTGNKNFFGGDGNDLLTGATGRDTLRGGAGRDIILGGAGPDLISGGGGKDKLAGQGGRDHIHGGGGDDHIDAGRGDDHVWGDAGNDKLTGASGADVVEGGGGDDAAAADPLDQLLDVESLI